MCSTEHRVKSDEVLHGLVLDWILIFAAAVGSKDGVFDEGHVSAEAGSNAVGILLVAHGAIDAVQGQGICEGFQQE